LALVNAIPFINESSSESVEIVDTPLNSSAIESVEEIIRDPLMECTLKCAKENNVTNFDFFMRSSKQAFPTPIELVPICQIRTCVIDCQNVSLEIQEYTKQLYDYICMDYDYAATVSCLNEHYSDMSTECLVDYYEHSFDATSTETKKVDDKPSHANICEYLHFLHYCVMEKMEDKCGHPAAFSFRVYTDFLTLLMVCPLG